MFAFFLIIPSAAAAAELRIAYADLQRALNISVAGKEAKAAMEDELKIREDYFSEEQAELKDLRIEIETKGAVWSDETRKKRETDFQLKAQALQRQFMKHRDEFNMRRQEIEAGIINDLREIVKRLAAEKGYTYVFEVSLGGIIYGPPEADLTAEVLEIFDREYRERTGK